MPVINSLPIDDPDEGDQGQSDSMRRMFESGEFSEIEFDALPPEIQRQIQRTVQELGGADGEMPIGFNVFSIKNAEFKEPGKDRDKDLQSALEAGIDSTKEDADKHAILMNLRDFFSKWTGEHSGRPPDNEILEWYHRGENLGMIIRSIPGLLRIANERQTLGEVERFTLSYMNWLAVAANELGLTGEPDMYQEIEAATIYDDVVATSVPVTVGGKDRNLVITASIEGGNCSPDELRQAVREFFRRGMYKLRF